MHRVLCPEIFTEAVIAIAQDWRQMPIDEEPILSSMSIHRIKYVP